MTAAPDLVDLEDEFLALSQEACDLVTDFTTNAIREGGHEATGQLPDAFGPALIHGLMQGLVSVAFAMALEGKDAEVQDFLTKTLALTIKTELEQPPEGSMVQ